MRVVSTDGTAVAGTDYTAVDQLVTFPAGETSATVTVPTISRGALAPIGAFDLALSEPSAGIALGIRTTATVTLTPTGQLPNDGADHGHPRLRGRRAGRHLHLGQHGCGQARARDGSGCRSTGRRRPTTTCSPPRSAAEPTASDWFGFSNDTAATDWSASDGFSFWFRGTGDGGTLSYELKSGGKLFDQERRRRHRRLARDQRAVLRSPGEGQP